MEFCISPLIKLFQDGVFTLVGSCQSGRWKKLSALTGSVTFYGPAYGTGYGNVGAHIVCVPLTIQNGWNSTIGNSNAGVYYSSGTWSLGGRCDYASWGCNAVCLD